MSRRPRILYLCNHCPTAPSYGAQIRALNVGRQLQRAGDVTLVLASHAQWTPEELEATRRLFDLRRVVRLIDTPLNGPWDRVRNEFDPGFLNASRTGVPREDEAAVRALLQEHDVVWISRMHMANAFRLGVCPRSILDFDDLMGDYYAATARDARGVSAINARRLSWIWRRREARWRKRFTFAAVCSEADRERLGGGPRVRVVPNGFEAPAERPVRAPIGNRLGFIGTFKYPPNVEGMAWFARDAWPEVLRRIPDAELRVIGAGDVDPSVRSAPRATVLGFVEDAAAEMATWSASIVPIHVGGGTRIKIAEAFSKSIPVVSTSLGAFGYEATNGRELLLADDAAGFAEACAALLGDPRRGEEMADRAWELFEAKYSWDAIGGAVADVVRACLETAPRASRS
jgi:glycosyltransferase involved in cell wall biosynthesis